MALLQYHMLSPLTSWPHLFDRSRIAALGIGFYLIMDMAIHWGVIRYLHADIKARMWVLVLAIVLDSRRFSLRYFEGGCKGCPHCRFCSKRSV